MLVSSDYILKFKVKTLMSFQQILKVTSYLPMTFLLYIKILQTKFIQQQ